MSVFVQVVHLLYMNQPLVLSIQSHMTHGRSGNRSAVLPIEVNGIDCDPINTVNFSTHTAYKNVRGTKLNVNDFKSILEGLRLNDILSKYTHLLTGYVGDPSIIDAMADLRKELGDKVHYLCDPVLGDWGRLYVSPECLELMKCKLVPLADTITPNSDETLWLTNIKMTTKQDLVKIVEDLHKLGPKNVVITSTPPEWKKRYVFFSFENGTKQIAIETETFNRKYDGPGDLFAALLVSNMIKYPNQFETIAERTVNAVFCVLEKTDKMNMRELAIPQSVESILNPPIRFKSITVDEFLKISMD